MSYSERNKFKVVDNVAELYTLNVFDGELVQILGYYSPYDSGPAWFAKYDQSSSDTVDGGITHDGVGGDGTGIGTGRYIVTDQEATYLARWGADTSGVLASDDIFKNASTYAVTNGQELLIHEGTYVFDFATSSSHLQINLSSGQSYLVRGVGDASKIIIKYADDYGALLPDKDFCRIFYAIVTGGNTAEEASVSNLTLDLNTRGNPFGPDDSQDKYDGDWAPTTAYKLGDRIHSTVDAAPGPPPLTGRVYECVVAGTSGAGPGPSGQTTGIIDGSVTWDYVANRWDNDYVEHSAPVFFGADNLGVLKYASGRDILINDRLNVDAIVFWTGTTGIIESADLLRCRTLSTPDYVSSRGDFVFYHGILYLNMAHCDLFRVESEYSAPALQPTYHALVGCNFVELDIASSRLARTDLTNCTVADRLWFSNTGGTWTGCTIRNQGQVRYGKVLNNQLTLIKPTNNVTFNDCDFYFYTGENSEIVNPVQITHPTDDLEEQTVDWVGCKFFAKGRALHLQDWSSGEVIVWGTRRVSGGNIYRAKTEGTAGVTAPTGTGDWIDDGGVRWDFVAAVSDDIASGYVFQNTTSFVLFADTKLRRNRLIDCTFIHQGGTFFRNVFAQANWEFINTRFACVSHALYLSGHDLSVAQINTVFRNNNYEDVQSLDKLTFNNMNIATGEVTHRFQETFYSLGDLSYISNNVDMTILDPSERVCYASGLGGNPSFTNGYLLGDTIIRPDAAANEIDRWVCTTPGRRGLASVLEANPTRMPTGTTAQRPTFTAQYTGVGLQYLDTDLGDVITWDGSQWISSVTNHLDNIAALQAWTGDTENKILSGHTTSNDIGGGEFWYDATDTTSPDDNGFIVVDASGRRWKRITPDEVTPQMYGGFAGPTEISSEVQLAANKAKELGLVLHFPAGRYILRPAIAISLTVGEQLEIAGESTMGTVLQWEDEQNTGRLITITAQDNTAFAIRNLTCDGNFRNNTPTAGDDQHHFLRVDGTAPDVMNRVEIENVAGFDMIADHIQFVHSGLVDVFCTGYRWLGGNGGRKNFQLSYHPFKAAVSNCVFDSFGTEVAGGVYEANIIMDNVVSNQMLISDCDDVRITDLVVTGGLTSLSSNSGSMTNFECRLGSDGRLAANTYNVHCSNGTFFLPESGGTVSPFKLQPLFASSNMDASFTNVRFVSDLSDLTGITFKRAFYLTWPGVGVAPSVRIVFDRCYFDSRATDESILQEHGGTIEARDCEFYGSNGVQLTARLLTGELWAEGTFIDHGNDWYSTNVFRYGLGGTDWQNFNVITESRLDGDVHSPVPAGLAATAFHPTTSQRTFHGAAAPGTIGGIKGDFWIAESGSVWIATVTSATDALWVSGLITHLDNIAALQAWTGDTENKILSGHTTANDIGGGEFWYDATDTTSPDDNGFVVVDAAGRRWKRITPDEVKPQMYGGFAGATSVGPQVQLAADKAKELGLVLHFPGLGPYIFDPDTDGRVEIGMATGQSSVVRGDGATVLKFIDGLANTPGLFWHMLYWVSTNATVGTDQLAELVHCSGFVVDGNFRNATVPALPGDVEQRSALKVLADQATGNFIRRVVFEDIIQVDPVADTIFVGPSGAGLVDTNADAIDDSPSIGSASVSRFHAGIRTGVRAAIHFGSQVGNVHIQDVTCDEALPGGEKNSIEIEYAQANNYAKTLKISNVDIDDLELGSAGVTDQENITAYCTNVKTRNFALMVYGNFVGTNCEFDLGISNTWRVGTRGEFTNCLFRHHIFDNGGTDEVRSVALTTTAGFESRYREIGCRHVIVGGTPDPAAVNAAVSIPNQAGTELGNHVVELNNVWFDPLFPKSVDNYAGGLVITRACKFGGALYAIQTGAFSTFGGAWESYDDDFTAVTGEPFRVLTSVVGSNGGYGELYGGKFNDPEFTSTGTEIAAFLRYSSRRFKVSAAPVSLGGVYGDKLYLDKAGYDAAISSDPIEWVCVATHITSATWIATLTKP